MRGHRGYGRGHTGSPQADKMAEVCKWEEVRGQFAARLPSFHSEAAASLPQPRAEAVPPAHHPAAGLVGSTLRLPHLALPRPGERFPRPRAAVGSPSFPAGGWPRSACVCLSVRPGLSAPSGKQGPEDPRAPPLFCGAGKGCGAKQTQQGRFVTRLCKKDSGA